MSIEEPISYADWYWKHSVDAEGLRDEQIEQVLAPVLSQMVDGIPHIDELPEYMQNLLHQLGHPEDKEWGKPIWSTIAETAGAIIKTVTLGQFKKFNQVVNRDTLSERMPIESANLLKMQRRCTDEYWDDACAVNNYPKDEARLLYESQQPYPAIPDIITASRYLGDPSNPKAHAMSLFDIPDKDYKIWDWLSYQKLTTEQVMKLYRMEFWTDEPTDRELARLGWHLEDSRSIKTLAYDLPNSMLLAQSGLVQGETDAAISINIQKGGIHPSYADDYFHAIRTKPATEDIVAYELRRDPSLSNLATQLRRIGIHPNYNALYKELAYQIPPVADIITMAVREAFTPAIAARFGQYQDLPPDFVTWVGKKGLSKEWAERYWAAHWSLPSPQQGFEMLHRGVIGVDDLNMLMRALDIMPFWRDKLTQIAYRPLSRVDVRRMFKLGVLDVAGIRKAYTDIGYNDYNANLMTQFTIEYTKGVTKKLPTTDIVSAYKKHLIDSGTLATKLSEAGIDSDDIGPIVRTAQQKRDWSDREDNIGTIEYLYKQGRDTEDQTIIKLTTLGLSDSYIQNLIPQWKVKSVAERETLWTNAQTLSFMKAGLITIERGKQELTDLGYDEEHIAVYLASVTTAA